MSYSTCSYTTQGYLVCSNKSDTQNTIEHFVSMPVNLAPNANETTCKKLSNQLSSVVNKYSCSTYIDTSKPSECTFQFNCKE